MKRPNVILISIDTLRADHLSCYGYKKTTTPNIDRLASEGTIFLQNYSTGVWTPPGHASMLTGLYVSEHGVYDTRKLAEDIPTIAQVLKRHGYQTAGFVNNSQVGALVGFDKGHDKFVEVWKGVATGSLVERAVRGLIRKAREALGHQDMGAARTNREFKDWIGNRETEKPFYAFLHYIEPHNPLNPPNPYRNKYLKDVELKNIDGAKTKKAAHNPLICLVEDLNLNRDEIEFLISLYDGEIEYTDSKIAEIISILKGKDLYDDTMIIITADHGEHFGEHNMWSHVASLYKEVLRVPLVIKYPKEVKYTKEVKDYTQLVDIFPTVMEVTGVSKEERIKTSGVSLVYNGVNRYHEYVFAEWEGRVPYFIQDRAREGKNVELEKLKIHMAMIQDGRYKYIWKSNDTEELYDILNSGEELQAIKADKDLVYRLRNELLKRKINSRDTENENQLKLDSEIEKNLKSLGYL